MSVITQPTSVVAKLSTIAKIRKYRGIHEEPHFISMAMEVHGAFGHDMDCFIKECACLFHDRQSRGHLSLFLHLVFLGSVLVLLFSVF